MHKAVTGTQQGHRFSRMLCLRQNLTQGFKTQAFAVEKIAALWCPKMFQRQGQVMRQRRVGHGLLGGKQNTHAHALTPLHEVGLEVPLHGRVIQHHGGMVVPSLDVAAGGPAGHEHPLAAFGGHTTQGQVFEGIDGHGRDVVPVPHAAQGFATLLAIALKRHIVLKLVCKHPQRQRIEALFSGGCIGDESQQVANELGCHKKPFGGVLAQVLRKCGRSRGLAALLTSA